MFFGGVLVKFSHSSGRSVFWDMARKYLPLIIVIAILVITQSERFIREGTLLGYQVRSPQSARSKARQNSSGSVVGGKVADKNVKSVACDTFPQEKVAKILDAEVQRLSGFVPDKTKPLLVSTCIYVSKNDANKAQTVSILLRDMKDDGTAKKTIITIRSGNEDGENITQLGDEAFYNKSANQLTVRKGNRLITVTVPKVEGSKKDNKTIAVEVSKIAL